jgi:hypothetical protein
MDSPRLFTGELVQPSYETRRTSMIVLTKGGLLMFWIVIGALLLCTIGFIVTLIFASRGDEGYTSEKSMGNLTLLYMILIPIAVVGVVAVAYLI